MRAQSGVALDDYEFFLFQDGILNVSTGSSANTQEVIGECCHAFESVFPEGTVNVSSYNLGVGLNFLRAEREIFDAETSFDQALFFEDDLVLGPRYFSICSRLLAMMHEDPRIGMVAAYGSFTATAEEQRHWSGGLVHMSQNWGFGLTRSFWKRRQQILEPYYRLIEYSDPRHLPHDKIYEYFAGLGYGQAATGQDGAIDVATCYLNAVRLMPYASNARYIGAVGLHSTPAAFAAAGFAQTVFVECEPDLTPPDEVRYRSMLERHRRILVDRRVDPLANRRQVYSFENPRTFVAAFVQPDSGMLYLHPSMKTGSFLISGKGLLASAEGTIIWGPYLPVSVGNYRCKAKVAIAGGGKFQFDVAVQGMDGFKIIRSFDFSGKLDVDFSLIVESHCRIEFRIACIGFQESTVVQPRLISFSDDGGAIA